MSARKGFTPSNFRDTIKAPYLTFALIPIGLCLIVLGFILYYVSYNVAPLGILPSATLYFGIATPLCSGAYLMNRYRKFKEAQTTDEKNFTKWVKETYNVTLNREQLEQLYYYGSTMVDGRKYILHYEVTETNTIAHLYTEAELEETLEAGLDALGLPEAVYTDDELITEPIDLVTLQEELDKAEQEPSQPEINVTAPVNIQTKN